MHKTLTYSKRVSAVLHLEEFTNAGLSQERAIELINKHIKVVNFAERYPINKNVIIHLCADYSDRSIDIIVERIKVLLQNELDKQMN